MIVSAFECPRWRDKLSRPLALDVEGDRQGRIIDWVAQNIDGAAGMVVLTATRRDGSEAARIVIVDGVIVEAVFTTPRPKPDEIGINWAWVNPDGVMSTEQRAEFEKTQEIAPDGTRYERG